MAPCDGSFRLSRNSRLCKVLVLSYFSDSLTADFFLVHSSRPSETDTILLAIEIIKTTTLAKQSHRELVFKVSRSILRLDCTGISTSQWRVGGTGICALTWALPREIWRASRPLSCRSMLLIGSGSAPTLLNSAGNCPTSLVVALSVISLCFAHHQKGRCHRADESQ